MVRSDPGNPLSSAFRDARSPSWSVRAEAGRRLAGAAEDAAVTPVLRRLLLDGEDTAVTQETAEALLERGDVHGLRLVLEALISADDDTGDHLDAAIHNVHCQSHEGLTQLRELCAALVSDTDAAIGQEAGRILSEWNSC
ncbi:HEAT repeat domain-containing protein [Streptomyces sp. NPDC047821]|uniref:HEAT repeat domain-containing protein n=1 Tax=Streptomyces sp. NPDC047821 TaxID=3365488 RepID=UPI003712A385